MRVNKNQFNRTNPYLRFLQHGFLVLLTLVVVVGCVYLRLYDFKVQLEEFDENFEVTADESFVLHFKDPMLYSEDFVTLAKLEPTAKQVVNGKPVWFYHFYQIDGKGERVVPGVEIVFQLDFNEEELLTDWHFSPIFLEMVPAEFLEASLRSLGTAEIDKSDRRVRAAAGSLPTIKSVLPTEIHLTRILGEPISVEDRPELRKLLYRFKLDTEGVEEGYEDRQITEVKLYFDNATTRLVRMKGRFAGLKLAIDYRKFEAEDVSAEE